MTLDPERRRAFLSCEDNELMTVFNLETNLCRLLQRRDISVSDGRPGPLPEAGGFSGTKESAQPGG